MVREFHERFGLPRAESPTLAPEVHNWFRHGLLLSETRELNDAIGAGDLVGLADALGDIVYVVYGTALANGIDLGAVLAEIHRSNMTKSAPAEPGGKAIKGPGYQPPDIERVLGR
jgi:predicted HAD superfamily Cof-like phosphohydrolase